MNRILAIFLLAVITVSTTVAQPNKSKKKTTVKKTIQERETEGQMRIVVAKAISLIERAVEEANLKLLSDSASVDTSEQSPQTPYKPYGWINDFTNLFTMAQQTELDSLITAFEKATTVEIAIVTIDSADTNRANFDDYITSLGNQWGVGKKETNNGVVIGICPGFKRIRISTGKGIVQQLTDEEAKAIIDNIIIPQYRQGEYFEGTKEGLLAVMRELQPSK